MEQKHHLLLNTIQKSKDYSVRHKKINDILDFGCLSIDEIPIGFKNTMSLAVLSPLYANKIDRILKIINLSITKVSIILALSQNENKTLKKQDIFAFSFCDVSNISSIIKVMRDEGLINVEESKSNDLKDVISLTEVGQKKIEELFEKLFQVDFFDVLTDEENHSLNKILQKLRKKL